MQLEQHPFVRFLDSRIPTHVKASRFMLKPECQWCSLFLWLRRLVWILPCQPGNPKDTFWMVYSTTHCADKPPPRGRKQIQINTDSHWIIDFLGYRSCLHCTMWGTGIAKFKVYYIEECGDLFARSRESNQRRCIVALNKYLIVCLVLVQPDFKINRVLKINVIVWVGVGIAIVWGCLGHYRLSLRFR